MAFSILCVIGVVLASPFFDGRFRALLFGCGGLMAGYLMELRGVVQEDWSYASVDSMVRVTDVPAEILLGYFTAAFFFFYVLVASIPRLSSEERRLLVSRYAFLVVGIALLVIAYATDAMSLAVGWAFLGIFGLAISPDRSVPLIAGVNAFAADWAVEGMLTTQTEYYPHGWDCTIGLVFMFAAMFLAGVLAYGGRILEVLGIRSSRRDAC